MVTKSNERYCETRTEVDRKPQRQLHMIVNIKWQILHTNRWFTKNTWQSVFSRLLSHVVIRVIRHHLIGQPFVKQFARCYRSIVLFCLSLTLVYCGQTVGWIKMKLGVEVGLSLHQIVLNGYPAPLPKGAQPPPTKKNFGHVCCSQTAGWIKMQHGTEGALSPGHTVLDGDWAPPPQRGTASSNFRRMPVVAKWLDGSRCHFVWS